MSTFWVKKYVKTLTQYTSTTPETALGVSVAKDVARNGDAEDMKNYQDSVKALRVKSVVKKEPEAMAVLAEPVPSNDYSSGHKSLYKQDAQGQLQTDDWGRAVYNEKKKYNMQYVPLLESLISASDIVPGAKFQILSGSVFIIDKVYADDKFGIAVETSLEDGKKGNYRDTMDELITFLNYEKAFKIE